MKRRILVLLLVLLLTLLCSCGHKHSHADSYSSDENYHWNECSCGDKAGVEQHSWNAGSVTVKPTADSEGERTYTCTVCRAQKTEKIDKLDEDHVHSYDNLVYDENRHWNECICGKKNGSSSHKWDDGVITKEPTETEHGEKTFNCTVCGCESKRVLASTGDDGLSFAKSTFFKMDEKLPKTPLTLEADIYVDPSMSERVGAIFGNYMGIRQDWLFEIHENGVPRFYYHDAGGNVKDYKFTNVDVRTGDWVHIAFAFDYAGGKMSVYLDGQLAQSIDCTADLAEDITTFRFIVGGDGRSDNSNYFKGKIRSVAAYSDVRTAEELAESAKNGVNSNADDILVHYVLNPYSGEADVKDLSPNGLDIAKEWLDSYESNFDYAYSFAVVGDTQWLSKYTPEKMEKIYDWILENQESKKIGHVFGLGDITEDWNTPNKEQEWIRAYEYISKLDGKLSYSLVRGNHDESKYFLKYFANEDYMSQFDGFMVEGDIRCSYMLRTFGKTDYLFLTLDFGVSDEMIEWANEVVLAHPNHKVIVTTHGYQAFNEDPIDYDNVTSSGGMGAANDVDTNVGDNGYRSYNNGQQVWDKFLSKHPNIVLIMSGHTPFEDVVLLQTEGNHGNVVNQMVIDAQWMDPQKGGTGMVCMLYFSEDGTEMAVEWISTDTGKYYQEHNQFVLDLTNSLNAPSHDFKNSYDEKTHHMACDCGYTHSAQPHVFDGGVLNADGFMVYSCACGYKRVASATNDPVALELQALLEVYYNNGVYYKQTGNDAAVFYNGNKYVIDGASYDLGNALSLKDIILGKHGDLKLDLGWNFYDGVYSSSNESTVGGFKTFAGVSASADRVTVTADGSMLIIKLWSGDSLVSETQVGSYAVITLERLGATVIDVLYVKADNNYMCETTTPTIDGYVAEYDKIILDIRHSELTKTVYYSTITKWDGKTVSTSLKGSGTLEDPFLIESGADLAYIAGVVNGAPEKTPNFSGKYFKMTQSIDLGGHNLNIGSYPGWGTRRGFYGFLDGNHCTIRGLNNSGSLFGTIEGGYLKNLSVYGKVAGTDTDGGIVAYVANGGRLENLTSYVTVTGTQTLGGIVGNAENQASDVINCVNYGSVTGTSYIIAGIAGSGGHNITGCFNFGNITSNGNDCVGGIAGSTKTTGSITECYNYGTINARGKAAGIAGQANKPIKDCINYGNVSGTWALGGVVGFIATDATASIESCENFGTISATSTGIGGILGIYYNAATGTGTVTIKNCVNNGAVSGTWGVGGIAGDTLGEVIDCVNNGTISAKGDLGGIIGKAYGEVTGCVNNGEIIGTQDLIGGIVGRLHVATHYSVIIATNKQNGSVTGPNAHQIIGEVEGTVDELITLNENVIGINHRGWYKAPENTLSAYRESKKQGFKYVECDVQFTKDGIPVLLHDDTIDRTSNGSGALSSFTYEQLLQYDFSYDDKDTVNDFSAYRGEKIPTFAEFIALCKELELHPYIEIKGSISVDEAELLVKIVSDAGMLDSVSWLSFSGEALAKIASIDKGARIVWVITDTNAAKIEANNIPFAKEKLMTGENVVVFDLWHSLAKQDVCDLLKANGILLEVWTVNDASTILKLNSYVTGVTSDMYDASQLAKSAE